MNLGPLTTLILLFSLPAAASGQDEQQPQPRFGTKVDAVRVDVLAMDRNGTPIKGLKKEDFRLYDEGLEQEITNFFSVEAPFSVGLVLDTSFSTVGKLAGIQNAAIRFTNALHMQDEVLVISFDDEVYLDSDFTRNRELTERAIKSTRTGKSTAVYEAVWLGLEQMQRSALRRVMIVFTDGVDTASPNTDAGETIKKAQESNVLIYTIYFDTEDETIQRIREAHRNPGGVMTPPGIPPTIPGGNPVPQEPGNPLPLPTPPAPRHPRDRQEERRQIENAKREYMRARSYMKLLAETTGGGYFKARGDATDLGEAFDKIAEELRTLYSLTFIPPAEAHSGEFRELEVRAKNKKIRVRHRKGYLAPQGK